MPKTHVEFFVAKIKFHTTFTNDVEFFIPFFKFHITSKKLLKIIEIPKISSYCDIKVQNQKEDIHENDRFF